MYQRLHCKTAFITGASAGIGEATARLFVASGSKVVITGRRLDRLQKLRDELGADNVYPIELDVRNAEAVNAAVAALPAGFAAIDVLVNNAGLAVGLAKTWEAPAADVDAMFDTNVKGLLNVTRAIVPGMLARNSGHIINIGSIAGIESYALGSVYCGTKFAVGAITEALRKELVATPLRVTNVAPGLTETEFSIVRFNGDAGQAKVPYQGIQPLVAEDIADNIAYVASRPAHVQVADIVIYPTNQAKVCSIHRSAI